MAYKKTGKSAVHGVVLYPCLVAMAAVMFIGLDSLIWHTGDNYPRRLAQIRYVDDVRLLTPQAMRDICNLPLTTPELVQKQSGLYLRCGVPGLEGVYRIELYETQKKVWDTFTPEG
ncbi:TPA: hypothetical protein PFE25_002120 [Kluyvera ascorbata]|nr:hypothetical protein [Kluyvera ascorbata]